MNDELNKRLIESIDKVIGWANEGEELVRSEAPKVIQELLTWGYMLHTTWLVITSVLALGALSFIVFGAIKYYKDKSKDHWDTDAACAIFWGGVIAMIPILFSFYINLYYFMKIVYAPRVYVLSELQRLF